MKERASVIELTIDWYSERIWSDCTCERVQLKGWWRSAKPEESWERR